jgi:VWFA-related protein
VRTWAVSVGAILPLALLSQQTPEQPEIASQESPVTFSSRVNLVSVPVVVRDHEGRAVGNLRKEDFQLYDKGKLQVITKFTVEKTEAPLVEAKVGASAAAPPERTAVSVPSKPALPERYLAYLVDDIHLKSIDLLNTRQAMNRHLDESLDPTSRAAIFTTSGRMLVDFTDDREKLHKAVNSVLPWTSGSESVCPEISYFMADWVTNRSMVFSGFMGDGARIKDDTPAGLLEDVVSIAFKLCGALNMLDVRRMVHQIAAQGERETGLSLGAVNDVIQRLTAMPGIRNLVLVSPGFIVTRDLRLAESDVFERAIRANIAVNTIDMRGLYTFIGDPARPMLPPNSRSNSGSMSMYRIDEASEVANVLAELADGTGGTFFHDDNGLKEGLNQLAARPEYIYVLGFSPQNLKFDGTYHTLKVTVRNPANPTLQVRHGYWAPEHKVDATEAANETLRENVFSRDEIHEIPVDFHTEFFKPSDARAELTVTAVLKPNSLRFQKAADRNNDTVTVVAGVFDANGNYVAGLQKVVQLRLRDQTLAGLQNEGIGVTETFSVAPGRYVVRLVVQDAGGQTTAARNEGIEIP